MTVSQLHELLGRLKAAGFEDVPVAVDLRTFIEPEDFGTILTVESAGIASVQPADDSGPVGEEEPFLVLTGTEPAVPAAIRP